MGHTKHTPGPWSSAFGGWENGEYGEVFSDSRRRIAIIPADFDNTRPTEAEANGVLIAAAPDLLAALEDVSEWLAACRDNPMGPLHRGETNARLAAARAAIAKAKGGAE